MNNESIPQVVLDVEQSDAGGSYEYQEYWPHGQQRGLLDLRGRSCPHDPVCPSPGVCPFLDYEEPGSSESFDLFQSPLGSRERDWATEPRLLFEGWRDYGAWYLQHSGNPEGHLGGARDGEEWWNGLGDRRDLFLDLGEEPSLHIGIPEVVERPPWNPELPFGELPLADIVPGG